MQAQEVSVKEAVATIDATLLDENSDLVVAESAIDTERKARIEQAKSEIADIRDSQAIISFGSPQQSKMASVSREMIGSVKNKDTGPAGDLLNDMMLKVRGLDVSQVKDGKQPGFIGRLFGAISPIAKFSQQFESVEAQMNGIERSLEQQVVVLNKDIVMLQDLYDGTMDHFKDLECYIAAGEIRMKEAQEVELPALKAEVEKSDDMVKVEELRAFQGAVDDLERKIHDLKLTRQVVMQFLPAIAMQIENDKSLINQINSVLVNTLNLWHVQVAQAISHANTKRAASVKKSATDLNNELLQANAQANRENNRAVREEMERGIFDIEVVEKSNQELIGAIMDTLEITKAGREKRLESEKRLMDCESQLKDALVSSS